MLQQRLHSGLAAERGFIQPETGSKNSPASPCSRQIWVSQLSRFSIANFDFGYEVEAI